MATSLACMPMHVSLAGKLTGAIAPVPFASIQAKAFSQPLARSIDYEIGSGNNTDIMVMRPFDGGSMNHSWQPKLTDAAND